MKKSIMLSGASIAFALSALPGIAFGQSDQIKKKPEMQDQSGTSGTTGGQQQMQQAPDTQSGVSNGQSGETGTMNDQTGQTEMKSNDSGGGASGQTKTKSGTSGGATVKQGQQGQTGTSGTSGTSSSGSASTGENNSSSGGNVQVNLSSSQQTEVKQVIEETDVQPVENPSFTISVGEAVPHDVELHPLPPRIVKIVPEYADYEYFLLADGRIVIIDPNSYEIVYVIS